jgi:hypothetical protein
VQDRSLPTAVAMIAAIPTGHIGNTFQMCLVGIWVLVPSDMQSWLTAIVGVCATVVASVIVCVISSVIAGVIAVASAVAGPKCKCNCD